MASSYPLPLASSYPLPYYKIKKQMKKQEAIKQLIADFKNKVIAIGGVENLEEEKDKEIAEALKII